MLQFWRSRILITGLLAVSVGINSCSKNSNPEMDFGRVEKQDLVQKVTVSGALRAKRVSYILPGYAGYIADLRVKIGDSIKEGAPLVRITQTVDQPVNQVFPIRAPFSGKVTQILKSEGEFVESGNTANNQILRIDDLSQLRVEVMVPEVDIAKIAINQEVIIRPNALPGNSYKGIVREISLSAKDSEDRWDRGKVEFPVSIEVMEKDDKLMPGMSAVADIVSAKAQNVLTLPHEYVRKDQDRYFVLTKDGEEKDIQIGLNNETVVEIKSGLNEGELITMIDFRVGGAAKSSGRKKSGRRAH